MAGRNWNVAVPDGDQQGEDCQYDVFSGNLCFVQVGYRDFLHFAARSWRE